MDGEPSESNEISTEAEVQFWEQGNETRLVDEETEYISYKLPASALNIELGKDVKCWDWNCLEEVRDDGNKVAKLIDIAWFSVRGEINSTKLSPEIAYEVFYVVKLEEEAKGWEMPVTLELSIHVGENWNEANINLRQPRQLSLLDQPRGVWIELSVGRFTTNENECKDILFDLTEINTKEHQRKGGLLLDGAIIRPSVS